METTQSVFEPFTRKWDGHDHYHFICWAYRYYSKSKAGSDGYIYRQYPYCRLDRWEMWDVAVRLYKTGKRHYVLDLSFEDFWQKLDPVESPYRASEYGKRIYKRSEAYEDYYPRDGAHFRQKVPLRIPEKKQLTEQDQQKKEWRKKKGIDRDKAKAGWGHGWRKPRRSGKTACNREYRRHVQNVIQKEQYEKLTRVKPKNYFDPWRFD